MSGKGTFRLNSHARIVVLPSCAYCKQDAPKCECGFPAWKRHGKQ